MKTNKIKRFNLEIPIDTYNTLLKLQKRIDAASVSEVIRRAIRLYDSIQVNKLDGSIRLLDGAILEL